MPPWLLERAVTWDELELIAIHTRKPLVSECKLKLLRTIKGQRRSLRLKIFKLQLAGMQRQLARLLDVG